MSVIRKPLREFLKQLERAGLTVIAIESTNKHIHLRFKEFTQALVISRTPSDVFAYKNALGDAKRLARQHQPKENHHVT